MDQRLFLSPERLTQLVMAMASHQLAEEELEEVTEEANECAGAVREIHSAMVDDEVEFIAAASKLFLEVLGPDRKIQCLRLLRELFNLNMPTARTTLNAAENELRVERPILFSTEKTRDLQKAGERVTEAELAVARWVGENATFLDEVLREWSADREEDPSGEDVGTETADELQNLMLEWEAATQAMLETIQRPAVE